MSITIRPATDADIATLAEFNQAMAWETEHRSLIPEIITQGIQSFLARPDDGFYLVAEIESRVAGCLMVTFEWSDWRNGQFWWIQSVYVHPDFRRQGVFKTLYQTVETRAQEMPGVCGLRLYVEQDNETAQENLSRFTDERNTVSNIRDRVFLNLGRMYACLFLSCLMLPIFMRNIALLVHSLPSPLVATEKKVVSVWNSVDRQSKTFMSL